MFGGRSYQLPRRWILYIFTCVVCQFLFFLMILRNTVHEEVPGSQRIYHDNASGWREFIFRTPERAQEYYQYNLHLSDTVGTVRKVPMTRHESCDRHSYNLPASSQAQVSVVISFHNEARSMLLRTIVSLMRRTPADYLHELIIVNDASQDETLLEDLRRCMGTQARPRLIFLTNRLRQGLIWSRNRGARVASGHYILFLDSHCEVNEGWLEPLLERLAQRPNLAVSPVLDPIDPATLSYRKGNEMLKGGFDWSLHFHWLKRELTNQELPEEPYRSPAFAGGVLMMSRDWFLKLGSFNPNLKARNPGCTLTDADTGSDTDTDTEHCHWHFDANFLSGPVGFLSLQIWGGESIELAIKLWLCGGQIEIVPCSRIGHIFRRHHAFDFPSFDEQQQQLSPAQETYLHNSKIIAESWLDEYKNMFYALKPAARRIPLNHTSQQLQQQRRELQCHRFDWYLRHVSPELRLHFDEFAATGTLRNEDRCLHHARHNNSSHQLILENCYRDDITQWILLRSTGQLSTQQELCLGAPGALHLEVILEPCRRPNETASHSQRWLRLGTYLKHAETHLCLDNPAKDRLELTACRRHAVSQSFQFALEMERQT